MNDQFILHAYPAILIGILCVWSALLYPSREALKTLLRKLVSRQGWIGLSIIVAVFAVVKLVILPPRHQVYFDEFVHEDIAANVAHDGTFGESLAGGADALRLIKTTAWPGGYHVLLGGVFKLFGASESVAFHFSLALGCASIVLAFSFATLLFKEQRAGLLAAFLLAATPIHLRFSGAADLTACSEFWILATLLSVLLYLEVRNLAHFALAMLSIVYAGHVRVENLILLPYFAGVLMMSSIPRGGGSKDGTLVTASIGLLLLTPILAVILHNRATGLTGYSGPFTEMFAAGLENGSSNLIQVASIKSVAFVLAPLSAFSLWGLPARERKAVILLLILALAYLGICSMHPKVVLNVGSNERFALPTLLLVSIAASGALATLKSREWRAGVMAAAAGAFVLLGWSGYHKVPLDRYEDEYRMVKAAQSLLPRDAVVLTFCPALILTATSRKALTPLALTDTYNLSARLEQSGCRPLVVLKDVWWYKFSDISTIVEKELGTRCRFQPLITARIDSREYGFYSLVPATSAHASE